MEKKMKKIVKKKIIMIECKNEKAEDLSKNQFRSKYSFFDG
jgi:hypothetical protein